MAAEQDAAAQKTGGSDPSTAYALTPLAGTRSEQLTHRVKSGAVIATQNRERINEECSRIRRQKRRQGEKYAADGDAYPRSCS